MDHFLSSALEIYWEEYGQHQTHEAPENSSVNARLALMTKFLRQTVTINPA